MHAAERWPGQAHRHENNGPDVVARSLDVMAPVRPGDP